MEKSQIVLEKLRNVIELGKKEYDESKVDLYQIKTLYYKYINLIYYKKKSLKNTISKKLNTLVKIEISSNKIVVLMSGEKRISFEVMEDDLKVVQNDTKISKPLNLIGNEILEYYNLVYPVAFFDNFKFENDLVNCSFLENNIIQVCLKNTDFMFYINCINNSLDMYYNSLKVMNFINDYQNDILKCIFVNKCDLPVLNLIREKLEEKSVKKKRLFNIFNR